MALLETTKQLCERFHIKPSRSKGQNFLIDEAAYEAMIEAAHLTGDEVVLEVGPGLGFLTERIARRTQKVFAVELDDALAPVLKRRLKEENISNVEIYNEDILNFRGEWAKALSLVPLFIVVANLPYNISSLFLRKFLSGNEGGILPERLTLMLQKEVAERLVALPGALSILGVSAQFYMDVKIKAFVPAHSFWPAPKVGSAVVTLQRNCIYVEKLKNLGIEEKVFFRLVKVGFSARRKMLKANLAGGLKIPVSEILEAFAEASISATVRAQELSLEEWLKIIAILGKKMV